MPSRRNTLPPGSDHRLAAVALINTHRRWSRRMHHRACGHDRGRRAADARCALPHLDPSPGSGSWRSPRADKCIDKFWIGWTAALRWPKAAYHPRALRAVDLHLRQTGMPKAARVSHRRSELGKLVCRTRMPGPTIACIIACRSITASVVATGSMLVAGGSVVLAKNSPRGVSGTM